MSNVNIADKLEYVAYNIPRIYEQGKNKGYGLGYDGGYSANYNEFWDAFQDNGNRVTYTGAFYGLGWNDVTFKPKYPLKPTGSINNMFRESNINDMTLAIDELDFTNVTTASYPFRYCNVTKLPKIIIGANMETHGFLVDVQKLQVINELNFPNADLPYSTNIYYCYDLQEANVSGVIKKTISFKDSANLTTEDAINTIMHLKDYGIEEGMPNLYKHTITLHADVWARLDALGGDVSPFGDSWKEYCVDLGWNVA